MTPAPAWTFAMIDLAGFTALTETHGDHQAADLAMEFTDIARAGLGSGDLLVKSIGDAVLLASPTPAEGITLVRRVITDCIAREGFLITRTGIHHGPATRRGDDFFGAAVNLTARIASHAAGGQVLATPPVAAAARDLGIGTTALGSVRFKNIIEPVALQELDLGTVDVTVSIDPVCRMSVDSASAAGHLRHESVDYWFCSLDCARQFAADPDAYADPQ